MGLDCSHDAWHGAYSAFHRWRSKIAEVAGLPPLDLMDGFYGRLRGEMATLYHGQDTGKPVFLGKPYMDSIDERLPISWDCLKPSPLHVLLRHSDCDGEIEAGLCCLIADELEKLIPLLPEDFAGGHIGSWREKTEKFVAGLRKASVAKEPLLFR